jgi:tRNA pseudouridine55 synthase
MDGVLVVDKPAGPTSHDVVARCRRALRTPAIGHLGTLDPLATGVLVLVVGRATRLAQFLSGQPKSYDATFRLGVTTDTWDRTGTAVVAASAPSMRPEQAAVAAVVAGFLGRHPQMPPPFSAKMIDGVRAHELARRGKVVAVQPAMVELLECELVAMEHPLGRLRLRSSAGYYVRSLVHDLGQALGCGACLEELRRTASGPFSLADAVSLAAVEDDPAAALARAVPMERLLPDLPAVRLDGESARRAGHGNEIPVPAGLEWPTVAGAPAVRLFAQDGSLLGVARPSGRAGFLHPAVVLK